MENQKKKRELMIDDSPPVISEEIMNLTLEELRESIAKQEIELYRRTLSKTRPAIMKGVEKWRETKNETLMSCLWSI